MNDHHTSDEDPYVLYLVVRESLGMSPGKVAAQCAHATRLVLQWYAACESYSGPNACRNEDFAAAQAWLGDVVPRIVILRADEKEWTKLTDLTTDTAYITQVDAGLTEVAAGTATVLAVGPGKKSELRPVVKRLQAYKGIEGVGAKGDEKLVKAVAEVQALRVKHAGSVALHPSVLDEVLEILGAV